MSRPQSPNRPFFPFGNLFRTISPKGSHVSPKHISILNAFEEALAERMRKLTPKERDEVLSFSWMKLAMQALSETHSDIKMLVTELEHPVNEWDDKWIDVYLDVSVKLLDLCIAFSTEIARLNQGHLLLQLALHQWESNSSKQFEKIRSSFDGWRHNFNSRNPRIENCFSILDKLVESLDMPKVKKSAKGKVLMRAMYGVKVVTVYICSVFAAVFSGSAGKLLYLHIADQHEWTQAFTDLQNTMNQEMRTKYSDGPSIMLKDLEAVDTSVKKLHPIIQDGMSNVDEEFPSIISDLHKNTQKFSQGLDLLAKEIDGFFKVVLTGRDALLSRMREGGALSTGMSNQKIDERFVR